MFEFLDLLKKWGGFMISVIAASFVFGMSTQGKVVSIDSTSKLAKNNAHEVSIVKEAIKDLSTTNKIVVQELKKLNKNMEIVKERTIINSTKIESMEKEK